MTGVMAAQPNISDDYFKSKRAAFLNALKCKTGLILAKAAAMHVSAILEPTYLAPSFAQPPSARRQMSLYTGALDHELRPPCCGAYLLNERLVLQGSCAFLALLMLMVYGSMLGFLNKFYLSSENTCTLRWQLSN